MKKRPVKNIAASVRQRLLDKSKAANKPFQELLQYYAMERFLFRLTQSDHAEKFVLKGALMFVAWGAESSRPTKDIDFLGQLKNDVDNIVDVIGEVCRQPVEADGLEFDHANVKGITIKEDADYEGVRATFPVTLGSARISMQIDIGFGDVIHPQSVLTSYPAILDHNRPELQGYPRETAIAEKFEAMVSLGMFNSRLKDFYDIWLLSQYYEFKGKTLAAAIEKTFANRKTEVVSGPVALTEEFAHDVSKKKQWAAFIRKSRLSNAPTDLAAIVESISRFLLPLSDAILAKASFEKTWSAEGPWS